MHGITVKQSQYICSYNCYFVISMRVSSISCVTARDSLGHRVFCVHHHSQATQVLKIQRSVSRPHHIRQTLRSLFKRLMPTSQNFVGIVSNFWETWFGLIVTLLSCYSSMKVSGKEREGKSVFSPLAKQRWQNFKRKSAA